jgi:Cytochrome c554 and c-prime
MSDRPSDGLPTAPSARRWPRLAAGAAIGLMGLAAAWWVWAGRKPPAPGPGPDPAPAPDPRLHFVTPYRNVSPDVRYVGDQACADCHRAQAEPYRDHPMGRALAPVAEATPIERYDPAAFNPFATSGLRYEVVRRDGRVWHREWSPAADGGVLAEVQAEVHFAIGSGAQGRSYAFLRDGYLFQSPVTWYPRAARWDLSPSYELRNQHFSGAIGPACLFCHCNQVEHVPGTNNRYRPPVFRGFVIGCERCHGPGELHIARRAAGGVVDGPDDTIVNPARLEYSLREAVCQQCHLQGEQRVVGRGRADFDYRPGLPLHLFLMDYVDRRAGHADIKFVNSVEQMVHSRCYRESQEPKKLGCTSCHDAHKAPAPAEKVAHYRGRCLQCHTPQSCSVPEPARREQNKDDSCVACHMPRGGSEVSHTSITDHRIHRRAAAMPAAERQPTPGPDDLVPFHRHLIPGDDEEELRNRGLAVMAMLRRGPPK